MKKLLISFSGGRTSAYMTYWLLKEREETLEFVKECSDFFKFICIWVEYKNNNKSPWASGKHKIVSFETASRKGEPFDEMMGKYGIVNPAFPHCSRELKASAIKSYARAIGWKKYYTAIGIRVDEMDRINFETKDKLRLLYPLATIKNTDKGDINSFWRKQPFDLRLKSYEGNCDLCWKKTQRKLMTIIKENPKLVDWWSEMEVKYDNYIPKSREENENISLPLRFYRKNMSISEMFEMSKQPFKGAKDESQIIYSKQRKLLDIDPLDKTDGCEESCEAFH